MTVDATSQNGHVSDQVLEPCCPSYVRLKEKINQRRSPFFSLEFFPPRTKEGAINLFARFDRLRLGGPLFIDITWHAASNVPCEVVPVDSIDSVNIAGVALNYCGLETVLHITCVGQSKQCMDKLLTRVKQLGIRNLLVLRGDKPEGDKGKCYYFKHPVDLINYIRSEHEDFFTIAVAGYPSGHPESESYADDLFYLKGKVDAGADFVVTQLFFEASAFIKFVKDCREVGIAVPVLPGVMPIQSHESLKHIVKLSKLKVPDFIVDTITPIKGNDEAIRNFGIDQAVKMCTTILDSGLAPGIHFYTLNREVATVSILERLNLWNKCGKKILPWPTPVNHRRCSEDVRPIFWSSRPKSYVYRTQSWDEFPNGRWGNSASPAFGQLKDYYLFVGKSKTSRDQRLKMWGRDITSEQDVWNVFTCYLTRERNRWGHFVTSTPWNEDELMPETNAITDKLAFFNSKGVLTINSQPNVNGTPSTDPVYGWGQPNGYVYQKAYLEFFTCRENTLALKEILKKYPRVNYHITGADCIEDETNCHSLTPIAVTWGVFPGQEVLQPTVVDPISFKAWKDEAFSLWHESWSALYPENSESRKVLDRINNSYSLINLVDNDYVNESCLWDILQEMLTLTTTRNQVKEE